MTLFLLQRSPLSPTGTELAMLADRYPHAEPIDQSLTTLYAHDLYISGYLEIAMLTFVLYNACYVVRLMSIYYQ